MGFAPRPDSLRYVKGPVGKKTGWKNPRRKLLGHLFFAFPAGWPGMALLLLRLVPGLAVAVEGGFYIVGQDVSLGQWLIGLTALAAGSLLVMGFLTPIAAGVVAAGSIGVALTLLPVCRPSLFEARTAIIFELTMLIAIMGLGPGAFSVDARMFGRREIIIPPLPEQ